MIEKFKCIKNIIILIVCISIFQFEFSKIRYTSVATEVSVSSTESNEVDINNNEKQIKKKSTEIAKASNSLIKEFATDNNNLYVSKHRTGPNESNISKLTINALSSRGIKVSSSSFGQDHRLFTDYESKTIKTDILLKDIGGNYISTFKYIDPFDITKPSNLSIEEINSILPVNLQKNGVAESLYNIEHSDKPVSALFVIALCYAESGGGLSDLSNQKKNLFGIHARDVNGAGFRAYMKAYNNKDGQYTEAERKNLMSANEDDYNKYGEFYNSYVDCINSLVNDVLYNGYFDPASWKCHGKSIFGVNVSYCSMVTWSYKILDICSILEEMLSLNTK